MTNKMKETIKKEIMEIHEDVINWICPNGTILLLAFCVAFTGFTGTLIVLALALVWLNTKSNDDEEVIIVDIIEEA